MDLLEAKDFHDRDTRVFIVLDDEDDFSACHVPPNANRTPVDAWRALLDRKVGVDGVVPKSRLAR
jgi:hypothetical protein